MHQQQIIALILAYIAAHRMSRAAFAARVGLSAGLINKSLTGGLAMSEKTLLRISAVTGLDFSARHDFDFQLHAYGRKDVGHLEGSFQTLRPSYQTRGSIQCYETAIRWDADAACLVFAEIGNDLSPGNTGYVSVPIYNRVIYLLTALQGNFRLAMLTDAWEAGVFYGGLLTIASRTMNTKVPAAALFVLKKAPSAAAIIRGKIGPEHTDFAAFDALLRLGRDQRLFDVFGWDA